MSEMLRSFVERTCPEAMGTHLSDRDGERLFTEKMLLTAVDCRGDALALDADVANRLSRERDKVRRLQALGAEIIAAASGDVRILKGDRYGRLYPAGVARYQGDLDVLFADEDAYVRCLHRMLARGLTLKACHLTQADDGGLYASSIFFESDDGIARRPEGLLVELHCRAFPITPFSHVDLRTPAVASLSDAAWDALMLVGEFVYRDGRHKRFVHRDLLDTWLVFSQLNERDGAALAAALDACALWIAVGLLRAHARGFDDFAWPHALTALFDDPRCPEPPADYDLLEHQAVPYLLARGRSRRHYDALMAAYDEINPDAGKPMTLTPFEIGARFGLGVPVACRLAAGRGAHSLLDACDVIAGAADARTVVHTRIGAEAPSTPQ